MWGQKNDDLLRLQPVPANEAIPASDFFRQPVLEAPKFNSAGTHFAAFVTLEDGRTGLMISEIGAKKPRLLKGTGDNEIYSFTWLNERRLLFDVMTAQFHPEGAFVADVDPLLGAYPVDLRDAIEPVGVPDKEPLLPIVWIRQSAADGGADGGVVCIDARQGLRSNWRPSWYGKAGRSEVKSGAHPWADVVRSYPRLPDGVPVEFFADRAGELAYGISVKVGVFSLYQLRGDHWHKSPADLDAIHVIAAGDKPGELLVVGPSNRAAPRPLQLMNASDGKLGKVLYQDSDFDSYPISVYRQPVSHRILGFTFLRVALKTVWFDPNYQRIQEMLERALPGQIVSLLGSDRGEKRFFLSAYSDRQPDVYYVLDVPKHQLGLIERTMPWIDPSRMRPTEIVSYKTRDGFSLNGYLTLPLGTSKTTPAPLVVLVRGGPGTRDIWGWDPEAQYFASRGFAVFQPNFRGASGTDWRFPSSVEWDFRKMSDDVTDGTKDLLRTGLIASDRVAVVGHGFGGYLALCGVTFGSSLYRCAVSIGGIFDWRLLIDELPKHGDEASNADVLKRNLGNPDAEKEKYDAISPLDHVDQIKVPIFIADGGSEKGPEIEQAKRVLGELDRNHVPHAAFNETGQARGLNPVSYKVELYSAIEAFLRQNLPPAAASSGAAKTRSAD